MNFQGDWHHSVETMPTGPRPHLMRTMLIANLAVDQRLHRLTTRRHKYKRGPNTKLETRCVFYNRIASAVKNQVRTTRLYKIRWISKLAFGPLLYLLRRVVSQVRQWDNRLFLYKWTHMPRKIILLYVLSYYVKVVSCSGTRVRRKTNAVLFLPTTLTFWPGSARSLLSRSQRCCQR